ncbi:hypothetical protein [Haliscomenobacter sp.]|uniref:hypothetical protein n=1 Tax=Haliscomenobacter sp. TaxID=2717303 RepID=UPI0033652063
MKNNAWIFYSIAAALFWGVWGVVAKFISEDVTPYEKQKLPDTTPQPIGHE